MTVSCMKCTVAKFIVPEWGDEVDFGTGLSFRPANLYSLAGRCDNPMPGSTLSSQSGTMNLATVHSIYQGMHGHKNQKSHNFFIE